MMKKLLIIIFGMLLILLVMSCVTKADNFTSGEHTVFINGKTDKNPQVKILVKDIIEKDKRFQVEIQSSLIPAMSLSGEIEKFSEKWIIYITGLTFFDNWPNGWISGTYEASGVITVVKRGKQWVCRIDDELEIWDIIEGQIRYYETYYRDFHGLRKVRNRVERLMEISRFLVEDRKFPGLFGDLKKETFRGPGFTTVITPYLFPERYGFNKLKLEGKLYSGYSGFSETGIPSFKVGAGLRWRVDYSSSVFPEYLQELRNSGTLWRDFEEGQRLFLSFYNLPSFFSDVISKSNYTFYKYGE